MQYPATMSVAADHVPGKRERLAAGVARSGLLPLLAACRRLRRGDLRILAYHRVVERIDAEGFRFDPELLSADAAGFRAQMQHVKRHYTPLRLAEAMARLDAGEALPPGALVVTFDDGYDDNYRVAFPILRELGMPATFFVSTGYIDSGLPYHYDWFVHVLSAAQVAAIEIPELGHASTLPAGLRARQRLAQELISRLKSLDDGAQIQVIDRLARDCGMPRVAPAADCRPMTWEQLREMHAGGMEIGSHGVGHRMLAKLDDAELTAEIVGSRDAIGRALGTPARVISYPVGGSDAWDERVVAAARAAGYVAGCSYLAGSNDPRRLDRFGLRRLPVERTTSLEVLSAMAAVPEWFGYASRAPRENAGTGQAAAGRSPAAAGVR